jgi:hypothetical protein
MTWEEAQDSAGFNLTGLITVAAAFILNLLNGTLLKVFPNLTLPEMNINDVLTVVLSCIAGVYTIVKIYHELLKIIDKRHDMKQKRYLDDQIRKRTEAQNHDRSRIQKKSMGKDK